KEEARASEATQRQVAEKSQRQAMDALRATTNNVVQQLIGAKPRLSATEKVFLESVLARWQAFAAEKGDGELARAIRAEGFFRVAKLRAYLGERKEAEVDYRRAIDIDEKLVAEFTGADDHRQALGECFNNLGNLLEDLGRRTEAEDAYRR